MSDWHVQDEVIKDYLQVCKEAVSDENVFNNFKTDKKFTTILEHCSYEIANNYLINIHRKKPQLLNNHSFNLNDRVGGAIVQNFFIKNKHWRFSTSTLQYVGVLCNLIEFLPSLDNLNIVEIGGGYGGQCKIIHDYFKPKSYTIVDLPEVCELQKKYLSKFNIKIKTINSLETKPKQYDVVISNYAITEVRKELKQTYLDNIVLKAKIGYITCNRVEANQDLIEIIQEKRGAIRMFDVKGESDDNCILYWNLYGLENS